MRAKTTEIQQVEETLHDVLRREFDARSIEFRSAGLRVQLDPISRSGSGSNYKSFIEAIVRYPDNDVHDIIFFYVAWEGRLVADSATMPQWITKTIEPPRESWRPDFMRGWADGKDQEISIGGA